jgi:hypothetical protein
MAIVLQPLENVTLDDIPPNLTNPSCQGTDGLLAAQEYNPYPEYPEFLRTNTSFPLPFDQQVNSKQISRWCPWDLQQNPPDKPGDGVYPYPDDNIHAFRRVRRTTSPKIVVRENTTRRVNAARGCIRRM